MEFYASPRLRSAQPPQAKSERTVRLMKTAEGYEDLANSIFRNPKGRLSQALLSLQNRGIHLKNIEQAVFAPRIIPGLRHDLVTSTAPGVRRNFIAPFLKALRGTRTLVEVCHILELETLSTYHHWETGRRDIPLSRFLKMVDRLQGRLPALLETLGITQSMLRDDRRDLSLGRYHSFFSSPWTPTVFLAFRLPQILGLKTPSEQAQELSRLLGLPLDAVEESMDLLAKLELICLKEGSFVSNPMQLQAIPSLSPEKIKEIHKYWFRQAASLLEGPGYHRLEQHALTHRSKDKIILWISELRDKIRQEVRESGDPETLIHIHWQVAEII